MKNVLIKKFQRFKKIFKKDFQKNFQKFSKKFSKKIFKNSKNFQKYRIYPSCVTIDNQKLLPLFA